MEVKTDFSNNTLFVRLKGDIDHHSAKSAREEIDRSIYRYLPETVIIDLEGIDFMDSSGLGLILGRFSVMKDIGGELVVINPNTGVMKILKLAGAERIIKIEYVDLEEQKKQNREKNKDKADRTAAHGKEGGKR